MKNIIRATPEDLDYRDRGVVKWLGMMLSDHSEALKKESLRDKRIEVKPKKEMTEIEISNVLYHAFVNESPILIQANALNNGYYYQDLKCKVFGNIENRVYLQLKDGRSVSCTLADIRNVEIMDISKWYEKE
jgi:hypothetical protein